MGMVVCEMKDRLSAKIEPVEISFEACTWVIQLLVQQGFGSKVVEVAPSTQNEQ